MPLLRHPYAGPVNAVQLDYDGLPASGKSSSLWSQLTLSAHIVNFCIAQLPARALPGYA
jgi:hypothetical protein